jgi:iron(III) transport system permease protein
MSAIAARLPEEAAKSVGRRIPRNALLWLLLAIVATLTVTPTVAALAGAFRDSAPGQAGSWTLSGLVRGLSDPITWEALFTTYWLAIVRAAIGVSLAVVIAWILARTDCPFRGQLEFLIILAYFFPGLGKLLAWIILASPKTGLINQALRNLPFFNGMEQGPLNVYSYAGIIYVSVIGFTAFFVMFLMPAFRAMDASMEESARMCGANERRALWHITVPLLRPAIAGITVLSMMALLSSFEIEVFLGTQSSIYVLTNRIYQALQEFLPADYPLAFTLSSMLLVSSFLLVLLYSRAVGQRSYTTVTGRSFSTRVTRLGKMRWVAFSIVAGYLLVGLILPLIVLVYASFSRSVGINMFSANGYHLGNWQAMLSLRLPQVALTNTMILSIGASTFSAVLGTVIAYVLVRTKFRGRRALEFVAWIPWAVPTIVLGLGFLWVTLFTPMSVLYGTIFVMILAHVVRSTPLKTRIMTSTIVQIDQGLEEAARVHGANWLKAMWHVWLPLVKTAFVAGWIISFAFSFGELALVAFLFGPNSSVLSTLFLGLATRGELERAAVIGLLSTAIVLAVVALVRRVTRTGIAEGVH